MPYLTTGLIDNTGVKGNKQSSRLFIEISNQDTFPVVIQIDGFLKIGTETVKYVDEFFTLTAGTVAAKDYCVLIDAFKFEFFVSSPEVNVCAWGKDVDGNYTSVYPLSKCHVSPASP